MYEVNIKGEDKPIEILSQDGHQVKARLGDKIYELDLLEVEDGIYSVIYQGKSYRIELNAREAKKYTAQIGQHTLDVEIVDAETRYARSMGGDEAEDADHISTPMPGQVVKILVEEGQKVKGGETVIIVSAMKMESEYKVQKDRVIKQILVKEGENIDGDQPLILFE